MAILLIILKAILIGFGIAAPVGPIGLLCIKYNLNYGMKEGMVVGLGAAVADATFAFIAGLGFVAITSLLIQSNSYIKIIGGLFLIYLGIKDYLKVSKLQSLPEVKRKNMLKIFINTYLLTLTNPMTILMFAGIISSFDIVTNSLLEVVLIIIGVFFGSMLWWVILSVFLHITKKRLSKRLLNYINKMSSAILIIFGLYALIF